MKTQPYFDIFQKSLDHLDHELFGQNNLELNVGIWLNCVVLKIQKETWHNQPTAAQPFQQSIFFSVWINDEGTNESKLYYNIHALKLRELKGYSIKSREFAEAFRVRFKVFEKEWPNVSTQFGPLTLMEGWIKIDGNDFEDHITTLANKFLAIQFIIDDLLGERKK